MTKFLVLVPTRNAGLTPKQKQNLLVEKVLWMSPSKFYYFTTNYIIFIYNLVIQIDSHRTRTALEYSQFNKKLYN